MVRVLLKKVSKIYNNKTTIIKDLDLDINSGEFVVFVGPSGCGKSTLLRMIAGLEELSGGEIEIDDKLVSDLPPSKRSIAMVFQSYALYPHMNVYKNMAFSLKMAKVDTSEIEKKVQKVAEILQLDKLLKRLPKQLSGGQRQRVAIGRAIVRDPKVFLFDEPLSNLDASLRTQTRIEIERLHKKLGATMIYVTHDQLEAMTLADRVVVLNGGKIEQFDTPTNLYHKPKNLFVAGFMGALKMNFIKTTYNDGVVLDDDKKIIVECNLEGDANITMGIRPEDIKISDENDYDLSGVVDIIEILGEYKIVYVNTEKHGLITVKDSKNTQLTYNDNVFLKLNANKVHIFNDSGISLKYI
jgi:ABC-type sugar transport system ATPase subunit